jgi:hypothetical protein
MTELLLDAAGRRRSPAHGYVFQYAEPGGSRLTDIARRAGLTTCPGNSRRR